MEMKLQHVCHPHPLVFEEISYYDEDDYDIKYCSGCGKPVWSPSYCCVRCEFFLHKECAEIPQQIEHPIHRKHPLVLEADINFKRDLACELCKGICWGIFYHCSLCNFSIHPTCIESLPTIIKAETHEHPFSLLCKLISVTCDACGKGGDYYPYLCTLCHITVHKECISLPKTIKIIRHDHQIKHTYFLHEISQSNSSHCGICYEEVSADHGCYYCYTSNCNYIVHAKCATRTDIWYGRSTTELLEEENKNNESILDSVSRIHKEIKIGEEVIATEIEHFSHQHKLTFCDEFRDDDNCCDGCMLLVSPPYYNCAECSYFLHKACAELPRKKSHPFHQHQLTLLSEAPYRNRVFWCNVCLCGCHGFTYNCEICNFDLDLRCASLFETLTHNSHHDHALVALFNEDAEYCIACGDKQNNFLKCMDCKYILDFKCATLPHTAKHRYNDNPLTLTFRDDTDQNDCDICEWKRDPKHWFYSSDDGLFTAHPQCVLGTYPYIKLGKSFTFRMCGHPHPIVTFVQKTRNYTSCVWCGELCKDLALECAQPECNNIIHWRCYIGRIGFALTELFCYFRSSSGICP